MATKGNIPGLQPRVFWGLTNGVKGNIHYLSDHDILYPAGGALILHNYVQKTQSYIRLPEPQKNINIITVSPNRKMIAVAEEGDKPCISLYDVKTLKRKKVLGLPFESGTRTFVSIAFTLDGKYLVAVTGDPNWMMVCYNWEKGKVESQTRANVPPTNPGPVTQIAPNPTDPTVMVIVGTGLFRLLSVSDTVWRQYGFQKADKLPISCVCWLNGDRALSGTEDGRLIIVENGDLKGRYKACDVGEIDLNITDENASQQQVTASRLGMEPDIEVSVIVAFSNGFAFSTGQYIVVFEKETKFKYKRRHVFRIVAAEIKIDVNKTMNNVLNLAVNPAQDRLIASTSLSQIYTIRLWEPDNMVDAVPMKVLGESLHYGPISALALCSWKTIFLTCGEIDRTVRVWDFQTESLVMSKQYEEDIYSLTLHPTGLYAIVGFSDKLRFMLVLLDDLSVLREFPIRMCQGVAFSTNGHMFAAIRSLVWLSTDRSLFSCGDDGALYEWSIHDGLRIGDIITKKCCYTDVAATQDGKMVYGVGSDGLLKEINNAEILREEQLLHHSFLHAITLSRSDLMMFVAGNRGAILSVKYPLPRPPEIAEYYLHKYPVTHMRLTNDDLNLISCSSDGTLCIWKLVNTERKAIKVDSEFQYSKEILINRDDLADKTAMIKYLENFVKSLETDHKYQVKEMETEHSEKTKELHTGYCAAIQDLKDKNQELIGEHTVEINKLNNSITELRREHNRAMENLESNYNAKLIVEYDKYAEFEKRSSALRDDLLRDINKLEASKKEALQEMAEEYEEKLRAKDDRIAELYDVQKQHEEEHEEIKQQIEHDADQEIIELKAYYEKLLMTERDTNIRLRGETGVMKKKFVASQREIEELNYKVSNLQTEQTQLKSLIMTLKQDIANLKKEIVERDNIIHENERKFSEVKSKNSELEKYKFVLKHKINELQMQIQPKEEEIQLKKEQIQDMEEEIQDRQKEITTLELQAVEYRERMTEQDKEYQREKAINRDLEAQLRRMCTDLHNTAEVIQDPLRLKQMVVKVYHKYCGGKEFKHGRQQDQEAQSEFMRQRDHLERTVASLKKLYHKEMNKKTSSDKVIKDNMMLIEEINALRKELKLAHRQIRDLQSITGLNKFSSPKEAQKRLQMAVKTREDIYREYEGQLQESQKQINMLEEEVHHQLDIQKSNKLKTDTTTQTIVTKEPTCIFDTYIGEAAFNDDEEAK